MAWYWWVLIILAVIVLSAWLDNRRIVQEMAVQYGSRLGSGERCDTCDKSLKAAARVIVKPEEMRLLAANGFGDAVPALAALPAQYERRSRFKQIACANENDWVLCGACHDKARPYRAGDMQSGMDDVYEHGLRFFDDREER